MLNNDELERHDEPEQTWCSSVICNDQQCWWWPEPSDHHKEPVPMVVCEDQVICFWLLLWYPNTLFVKYRLSTIYLDHALPFVFLLSLLVLQLSSVAGLHVPMNNLFKKENSYGFLLSNLCRSSATAYSCWWRNFRSFVALIVLNNDYYIVPCPRLLSLFVIVI